MSRFNSLLVFVVVPVFALQACSLPGASTPDPNLINTMVAQTFSAIQIQSAVPATATPTFTPEIPTLTSTATLSPTPEFTATPSVPQIRVSVPTNCRVGPGRVYDRVGALLVDEVTEVYGRDPTGNYWYVRNPDVNGGFCWLWGEYAALSGNFQVLPVFTPPPTPTPVPAFTASYTGLEWCNNVWWVEFRLENTGGITFRSISLSVFDTGTNSTVSLIDNKFTNLNGCNASDSRNAMGAGDKFIVSSPAILYDPTGKKLRATITLCSENGINGTCATQTIEFKP
ncbi:MAG: hypothetical protein L6Q26_05990 [Anaerolineales bacterium]|nr:hypothetical protein [Anaerolineales bacterium]NUQ83649.1 hypothetical protein [Anaerolineales bacterium]